MTRHSIQGELRGEAAQEAFGRALVSAAEAPMLVFLEGDLGAGKTTLTRGMLQGLGHQGPVKSPTYTLIEPYDIAGRRFYHLDLYRVGDPDELEYLGLREMLAEDAIMVVEWPERGAGWLPEPDLRIRIAHAGAVRTLSVEAVRAGGRAVLGSLAALLQ